MFPYPRENKTSEDSLQPTPEWNKCDVYAFSHTRHKMELTSPSISVLQIVCHGREHLCSNSPLFLSVTSTLYMTRPHPFEGGSTTALNRIIRFRPLSSSTKIKNKLGTYMMSSISKKSPHIAETSFPVHLATS